MQTVYALKAEASGGLMEAWWGRSFPEKFQNLNLKYQAWLIDDINDINEIRRRTFIDLYRSG